MKLLPRVVQLWLLPALILVLGVSASWSLSQAFRQDTRQAWEAQAEQTARWLSGTLLAWLEESYAPLSGLAVLAENSETLTEAEFLNGFDALEARATAFFLDSVAYLEPMPDQDFQLVFTSDITGPLAAGAYAANHERIRTMVAAAVEQPGRILLGPPFKQEAGLTVSMLALAIYQVDGSAAVVLGLVNHDALIGGLFEQLVPAGLTLQVTGKFLGGDKIPVYLNSNDASLHAVTTRTISAGADLSITWHAGPQFNGGVPERLARLALLAGIAVSAFIALFIGMLLRRNRLTSQRIEQEAVEQRERELNELMDVAPFAIVVNRTRSEGFVIEHLNRRFVDLFGWTMEESTDFAVLFSKIYPDPEYRQWMLNSWKERLAIAVKEGKPVQPLEAIVRCKNGEDRTVVWGATAIGERQIVMAADVTDRKAMENELQHTNFLNDQALGLTRAGYWHVPLDGSGYYNSSRRAVDIFGDIQNDDYRYRVAEDWFANVEAGDAEAAKLTWINFEDAIAGKIPAYDSIYAYKRPVDERVVWIHAFGTVARDSEGNATDMYGVTQDITEYVQAQQELELAKEAADEANQAKSTFLANMSHELRTPMNAILGYSEMLIEEAEDLEQEDFIPDLKKINQAGTHLLALINDVLDLAKVESGKMEAFAEDIDVDNLIDEVSSTAHPLMEKNSNTLSIERSGQLGRAHQDLTKLRQTLFNLLSNAAKFTHNGTVTLHAERTVEAGTDWLTLAVSDTGIGIPADRIDHVFKEFTQADNSTTRDYGGTGLGLAISRRFCELLGGSLSAASETGKGSTFTIRVPALLPGTKPQAAPAGTPAISGPALETLREAGPGETILVIDDDPEAREIIERYLTKDSYSVATAASGEQGLRLAHEIQPAAITLDVMMPDMDGWSVLRVLKADPLLRTIPVIMLSMIDDRTRGYSLGAVDYLTKPVDREQLNKTLSRYYCAEEDVCAVLLVEDDTESREVMARTLEKAGWTVSEAGNGQEALDMMSDLRPQLILLDLMMPVMDGFDFLAALRAQPEWQQIPVIVITAKDLTADDRSRLAGRVEDVLEKSAYTREQLLQRVSEAVAASNIRTTGINTAGKNND